METDRVPRTTVAVRPGAAIHSRPRLFAALEAAFPVSFAPSGGGTSGAAGAIEVGNDPPPPDRDGAVAAIPTLRAGDARSDRPPTKVLFAERGSLDRRIRGLSVSDSVDAPPPATAATADEEILAAGPAGPATPAVREYSQAIS